MHLSVHWTASDVDRIQDHHLVPGTTTYFFELILRGETLFGTSKVHPSSLLSESEQLPPHNV